MYNIFSLVLVDCFSYTLPEIKLYWAGLLWFHLRFNRAGP